MPRRKTRRAAPVLGAIVAITLLLAGGLAGVLWSTLPPAAQTLRIPGLSGQVDVTLDSHGVPRIRARNEADAAVALGYLHARDRMFQMELMRRQAQGRLAELAGPRAIRIDRMSRIFGLARHAEATYATLPDPIKTVLAAYTRGVNAWIAAKGRWSSPEFLVLGPPEPWRPADCLLWSETVSLWLSDNYRTELARASLAGKVGLPKLLQLWPATGATARPDAFAPAPPPAPLRHAILDRLPAFPDPFTLPSEASNAWAADARHTSTGAPLLAGDPHLALGFPGLWYLARIDTPGHIVAGATAPGVPFLIIGRTEKIAWSFTTTGIDTQDVFVETALPNTEYATPEGPRAYETRDEIIHVRGAPDVRLTVRATRHGPVISGPFADDGGHAGDPVLAVAAAQFQLGSPAPGLYALNHATGVAEAGEAAALMTAPMQNLTVADHDTVALFTTGKVPLRHGGDSPVPVQGADGQHDWIGFASGESLPNFISPASGLVENANERTAPDTFTPDLGRDFPQPIRARRIHELLSSKQRFSSAEFAAMQADATSVLAQDLLPVFRALPRETAITGRVQALLGGWDGLMKADRPEPLVFNAAVQLFVARALAANQVPEEDAGPWSGFAGWLLLDPAGAAWCGGDCRPKLADALRDSTAGLADTYGRNPDDWRWGDAHQAVFAHPLLGALPVIGRLATARVPVDGDDTTLFRGGNGTLGRFESLHGAAYRGVYDLADLDRSRFVVSPGQSGNLLSRHAWDLLPLWARGDTITLAAAPDRTTATITLQPTPY